jgi:16S rRNA processing protein RimM
MPAQRGDRRAEIVGEGWTEVGRVARACGLDGALAVALDGAEPEELTGLGRLCLVGPAGRIPFRVESARALGSRGGQPPQLELRLVGMRTRAQAERWVGARVSVPPEVLRPPAGDEIRARELVGLRVRLPDGRSPGRVDEVWSGPAHDLLVLRRDGAPPILIPATPPIVTRLDLAAGELWIDPPEGLIPPQDAD